MVTKETENIADIKLCEIVCGGPSYQVPNVAADSEVEKYFCFDVGACEYLVEIENKKYCQYRE